MLTVSMFEGHQRVPRRLYKKVKKFLVHIIVNSMGKCHVEDNEMCFY